MNWTVAGMVAGWIILYWLILGWKCRIQHGILVLPLLLAGAVGYAFTLTVLNASNRTGVLFTLVLTGILTGAGLLGYVLYRFTRNPSRPLPVREDMIFSPADGIVRYVRKLESGDRLTCFKHGRSLSVPADLQASFLKTSCWHIGIEMSLMDVHVNRIPASGKIIYQEHCPGRFLSLRNPEAVSRNEQVATIVAARRLHVGVIQIASRMVRRIVTFRYAGDSVRAGEPFGRIIFGSQVDLVFPCGDVSSVNVKTGDRVLAGVSVIAHVSENR